MSAFANNNTPSPAHSDEQETDGHRLSVIIPTLNEAIYLPRLLDALDAQTYRPHEIIVADAGSTDDTAAIARQHGANVVIGGMPAVGRNRGAHAATGDLLLFFDADVLPEADFLEQFVSAFAARDLDVATCLVRPIDGYFIDQALHDVSNLYMLAVQSVVPHAPGFSILVKKSLHEQIGGFDEAMVMAEDHDYVRRASQQGRFGIVTEASLPVSTRRIRKEGVVPLAVKYLWAESMVMQRKPIYDLPFEYRFGDFQGLALKQSTLKDYVQHQMQHVRRQIANYVSK